MPAKRTDNKGRVLRTGESQRKDLTYMYRYTDKWGDRVTVYAPTLQELREKEKQTVVADVQGVKAISQIKLSELMDRAIKLAGNTRKSTIERYEIAKKKVLEYPIAQKRVKDIKPSEAKAWLLTLIEEGVSPSYAYLIVSLCKRSCQIAVDDDLILKNPFNFSLNFLPPRNKRTALSEEEQRQFFEFLETDMTGQIYYDHLRFLVETGLRLSEFRGLTKANIDLCNRRITIDHQLNGADTLEIEKPKTKNGNRKIPLSDAALKSLVKMMDKSEGTIDITVGDYTDFIIPGRRGGILTRYELNSALETICSRYNKKFKSSIRVSPHILRHTFCTNMVRKGISVTSLQYLMGHASAQITLDIYTHIDSDHVENEFRSAIGEAAS